MFQESEPGQILSFCDLDGELQPLRMSLVGHISEMRTIVLSGAAQPESFLGTELLDIKPSVRLVSTTFESSLGTIQLTVDPALILNGRHIYLVDLRWFCGTPLCRLIVSSEEIESRKRKKIATSNEKGVLYQGPNGDWAGLGGCNYEFLVDTPCSLSLFNCMTFQGHNSAYCFRYGDSCRQFDPDKSICELLALAISRPDLGELTALIRASGFIVSGQLLVPFGIYLRKIERTFSGPKEEAPDSLLREAFTRLGMGDEIGANEIFCRTDREQTNQFLLRGLEKVLGHSLQSVELYIK